MYGSEKSSKKEEGYQLMNNGQQYRNLHQEKNCQNPKEKLGKDK
tara:strand:+ start:707 stop:838 length:132 start_codon:yes stop_codon:yes gene_type:complete